MQKNQSLIKKLNTSEEKDLFLLSKIKNLALSLRKVPSLIKNAIVNNAQKMVDAIKSPKIKKQALALLASAVMLTSAGCAEVDPSSLCTSKDYNRREYSSIVSKDLFTDERYSSINEEYQDWYSEKAQSWTGFSNIFEDLKIHPLNYKFFKDYYGENMPIEEINKKVLLVCQFVDEDGALYVQYAFDNKGECDEGSKNAVLLKYNLPIDVVNDLIKSGLSKDNVKNLMILENIVNDYDHEVLAKQIITYPGGTAGKLSVAYPDSTVEYLDTRCVAKNRDIYTDVASIYAVATDANGKHSFYIIEQKLTEDHLRHNSGAGNEDYMEYPRIVTELTLINGDSYGKSPLPEGYHHEQKEIIYVGDYIDEVYKGVAVEK